MHASATPFRHLTTITRRRQQVGRIRLHDFNVFNGGSIILLQPLTPAANDWVNEFLPEDRLTLGSAVAVEHRFIGDILGGITRDGLSWSAQ